MCSSIFSGCWDLASYDTTQGCFKLLPWYKGICGDLKADGIKWIQNIPLFQRVSVFLGHVTSPASGQDLFVSVCVVLMPKIFGCLKLRPSRSDCLGWDSKAWGILVPARLCLGWASCSTQSPAAARGCTWRAKAPWQFMENTLVALGRQRELFH